MSFLTPPANGLFGGVFGPIQLLVVRSPPLVIARQATPQGPAIQIQQTQPIDQARHRPFLGRSSQQIATMQSLHFLALLLLSAANHFPLPDLSPLRPVRASLQSL